MMNDAPMHKDEPIAKSNPLVLSLNPCCDPSRKWGSSIKGYDDDDDKEEEANRAARVVIFSSSSSSSSNQKYSFCVSFCDKMNDEKLRHNFLARVLLRSRKKKKKKKKSLRR